MRLRLLLLGVLLSACSPGGEEAAEAPRTERPAISRPSEAPSGAPSAGDPALVPVAERVSARPPAEGGESLAENDATIPGAFRGRWAGSPERCNVPSESSLAIHEDRIDFYESRGRVLSVTAIGEREIEIALELTGEGETWRSAKRFTLSEDGRVLTDVTDGSSFVRVRCE